MNAEHMFLCYISEGDFKNALDLLRFCSTNKPDSITRGMIMIVLYDFVWFQTDYSVISESLSIISGSWLLSQGRLVEACLRGVKDEEILPEFAERQGNIRENYREDRVQLRKKLHAGDFIRTLSIITLSSEHHGTSKSKYNFEIYDKNTKIEFIFNFYMSILLASCTRTERENSIETLIALLCHPVQHSYASDKFISDISHWINQLYRLPRYADHIKRCLNRIKIPPLMYLSLDRNLRDVLADTVIAPEYVKTTKWSGIALLDIMRHYECSLNVTSK